MTETAEMTETAPYEYREVQLDRWTYLVGTFDGQMVEPVVRLHRPSSQVDEIWFEGVVSIAVSQLNGDPRDGLAHLPRQPFVLVRDHGDWGLALSYPHHDSKEMVEVGIVVPRGVDADAYEQRARRLVSRLNATP
jgi:hypothetical protein